MTTVTDFIDFLQDFAPPPLAESWDNVGLLVGRSQRPVTHVMTCLTITPDSAAEAIAAGAQLIITHHPLPFRPLKRLTDDSPEGRMLLDLINAGISIYSPHTAFDSAVDGINQRLAAGLGLREITPIIPQASSGSVDALSELGAGRHGVLAKPTTLSELTRTVKAFLAIDHAQAVGDLTRRIQRVAIACGSAGEFLGPAQQLGCEVLVTGEVRFHTALEAEALDVGLVLAGHFASERFALEHLATILAQRFAGVTVWASRTEKDPIQWL